MFYKKKVLIFTTMELKVRSGGIVKERDRARTEAAISRLKGKKTAETHRSTWKRSRTT